MNAGRFLMFAAPLMWVTSFSAGQSSPQAAMPLEQLLPKVRTNVQRAWASLPDFVCTETISSKAVERGKTTRQKTIESIFSSVRQKSGQGYAMTETREVSLIDGKAVPKGTPIPDAPLLPDGSTASLLFNSFSGDSHVYKAASLEKTKDRQALKIEFASRENQQTLTMSFEGKQFVAKDQGSAWIDLDSLHILRLELRILNMPGLEGFTTSIDYRPFDIGKEQYWLPTTVSAEAVESGGRYSYVAEYDECKKFDVSTKIKF